MTPQPLPEAWYQGYYSGLLAGIDIGRQQAEDDMDAAWSGMIRHVQATLKQPTYAELCDRRNEPDRAARARQHEARLGLRDAS